MITTICAVGCSLLKRGSGGGRAAATTAAVPNSKAPAAAATPTASSGSSSQAVDDGLLGASGRSRQGLVMRLLWPKPPTPNCPPLPPHPSPTHSPADFICASPLLPNCGLSRKAVAGELGRWRELGGRVQANLGLPADVAALTPAQK